MRADQPADDKALAIGQRDAGVGAANGERRDRGATDCHAVVEVEFADFRRDFQGDAIAADHGRRECQADPEFLVLDGVAVAVGAWHRDRYFATGQETRTLPADATRLGRARV